MTESSLITEELRKLIGAPLEPTIFKVEEGAIQRYADAMDDPNPLYNDVEYAKKTKYGRLICPPGFTGLPDRGGMEASPRYRMLDALAEAGAPPRGLDGGIEFEFLVPIGAGDVIVAISKFTEIYEKETRIGKMLFAICETTFINQTGEVALRSWTTGIKY